MTSYPSLYFKIQYYKSQIHRAENITDRLVLEVQIQYHQPYNFKITIYIGLNHSRTIKCCIHGRMTASEMFDRKKSNLRKNLKTCLKLELNAIFLLTAIHL